MNDFFYIVLTYDDRTHVITKEQAQTIVAAKNSGKVQSVSIGNDVLILSNIRDIPTVDTYHRQMKHKLQEKGKRMCGRCFTIVPRMDTCPCVDNPEKYPSYMDTAAQENPQLADVVQELLNDGVKLIS